MTNSNISANSFKPARVVAVDLISGHVSNPGIRPHDASKYRRVSALVTLGSIPVVIVGFPISDGADDAEIARLAHEKAWEDARELLVELFDEHGCELPRSSDDLAGFKPTAPERPFASLNTELATTPKEPFVTVAICTLNNDEAAIRTAERVLGSDYSNFEVVVVDNASSPEPLRTKLIEHFGDNPNVRHAHEPSRGLSFARNKGWKEARGDIVVFTDDDVLVAQCWVRSIAKAFSRADHVGCVTGPIIPSELETRAQDLIEQYGGYNKGFKRQIYDNAKFRRDDPLYPYNAGRFGSGANMAISKAALDSLGGFATELGAGTRTHGGEDIDVLQRIVTNGFAIVYEPSAWMWHQHRRSYAMLRRQMFRYGVGLGATITKWVCESRKTKLDVVRRIPRGVSYLLYPKSQKNRQKAVAYPRSLTFLELTGFAYGPIAYVRSLFVQKKQKSAVRAAQATRK